MPGRQDSGLLPNLPRAGAPSTNISAFADRLPLVARRCRHGHARVPLAPLAPDVPPEPAAPLFPPTPLEPATPDEPPVPDEPALLPPAPALPADPPLPALPAGLFEDSLSLLSQPTVNNNAPSVADRKTDFRSMILFLAEGGNARRSPFKQRTCQRESLVKLPEKSRQNLWFYTCRTWVYDEYLDNVQYNVLINVHPRVVRPRTSAPSGVVLGACVRRSWVGVVWIRLNSKDFVL